jgi:hypothetical protein
VNLLEDKKNKSIIVKDQRETIFKSLPRERAENRSIRQNALYILPVQFLLFRPEKNEKIKFFHFLASSCCSTYFHFRKICKNDQFFLWNSWKEKTKSDTKGPFLLQIRIPNPYRTNSIITKKLSVTTNKNDPRIVIVQVNSICK